MQFGIFGNGQIVYHENTSHTVYRFAGLNIKVKFLRIQRKLYREENKELTKDEYEKLLRETTRIYLLSTGAEHARQLEELGPVQ